MQFLFQDSAFLLLTKKLVELGIVTLIKIFKMFIFNFNWVGFFSYFFKLFSKFQSFSIVKIILFAILIIKS